MISSSDLQHYGCSLGGRWRRRCKRGTTFEASCIGHLWTILSGQRASPRRQASWQQSGFRNTPCLPQEFLVRKMPAMRPPRLGLPIGPLYPSSPCHLLAWPAVWSVFMEPWGH
jgi:hypothetical protein